MRQRNIRYFQKCNECGNFDRILRKVYENDVKTIKMSNDNELKSVTIITYKGQCSVCETEHSSILSGVVYTERLWMDTLCACGYVPTPKDFYKLAEPCSHLIYTAMEDVVLGD